MAKSTQAWRTKRAHAVKISPYKNIERCAGNTCHNTGQALPTLTHI